MKKLTETQERLLSKIQENLRKHKECKDTKDFWMKQELKGQENRPDYEELKQYTEELWEKWKDNEEAIYGKWIKKAKEQNIVLATGNTATLKALEKAGYIEIINIGGNFPDEIKVLIESKDEQ